MEYRVGNARIGLLFGDITEQQADALVNAANAQLAVGSGVDRAIHKRGGPKILQDLRQRYPRGCRVGGAVPSVAGNLPCKIVIHAVGPIWRNEPQRDSELLRRAYQSSLEVAAEHECRTLAFPAISCGSFGFPTELAAEVALAAVRDWVLNHPLPAEIRFVFFSESAGNPFLAVAARLFSADAPPQA